MENESTKNINFPISKNNKNKKLKSQKNFMADFCVFVCESQENRDSIWCYFYTSFLPPKPSSKSNESDGWLPHEIQSDSVDVIKQKMKNDVGNLELNITQNYTDKCKESHTFFCVIIKSSDTDDEKKYERGNLVKPSMAH